MKKISKTTNLIEDQDKEQKDLLKIGDVARLSGVGIEALRFYEKSGLLDKPVRTYSGYRMYSQNVLERLSFIKKAQVLGFSLEEIKQVIKDSRGGQKPCDEVRELVRQKLIELDIKLKQLQQYRDELATTLQDWDNLGQADGHICGLIENSNMGDSHSSHKHSKQLITERF
ncbi:MAG: heavy metal-responsive transcriptional regulator [Blastocatellia bacterium]|nr:heavy metal-responsive transcriptional regulator [Blastocatellia bacterium]